MSNPVHCYLMAEKNIHAVALGRRGGLANSPAQQAARKKPKAGAGRPRKHPKPA